LLSRVGKNNDDGSFDWSNALVDAGIMAGSTFFTSLGAMMSAGGVSGYEVFVCGVAAAAQFFIWLAIKRGLREKES